MRGSRLLSIALVGFLAGVFVESYFGVESWLFFAAGAVGIALSVFEPRKMLPAMTLFFLLFGSGVFLAREEIGFWRSLPEQISFAGEVTVLAVEEPKAFYRPVTVAPSSCEGDCLQTKILWRAPITNEAQPGERHILNCELGRPENFDPAFDYRSYLAGQGVGYLCPKANAFALVQAEASWWRHALHRIRMTVEETLRQALPEPEAGLALGLTLGGNDYLSREMKDIFARTGLSHIVAVSGFNMTVLVQFALVVGLLSGLWRRHALLVSAVLIVLFLLLIGAPASALRAALMTGAAFLAYFFGRLPTSTNALLLAAALMLSFNPLLLRFDVGFQLSFLATLALIVGGPLIETLLPLGTWWGKALAIPLYTFIIELFTFPVLFGTFGQASLIAPLTNFLVLPLVPVAMILALLSLPILFLAPAVANLVSFPLWLLLALQTRIAEWFDRLPFGLFRYDDISLGLVVAWYSALVLICFVFHRLRHYYVFRLDH